MSRSINKRLEILEAQTPDGDHEYTADIGWEGENCHYYRDGIEISRAQYFKEAPKNQPIEVVISEIIPAWQDHDNPELWHLESDQTDDPIGWNEVKRRYPDNKILKIEYGKKPALDEATEGARSEF